jgi:Protein of unknown function (DUF3309)
MHYLNYRDSTTLFSVSAPKSRRRSRDRVIGGNCMRLVILVVLIVLLLGALPTWPYSTGWGYYPSGGLGLVLLIVVVLALMGRL